MFALTLSMAAYFPNFYAFKRFSDEDKMSTNNRVINLLNRFGLDGRLVENFEILDLTPIHYNDVNKKITKFREESKEYLENALKDGDRIIND